MIWRMENNRPAPTIAVNTALAAATEFGVPTGILLGTVECETDFRLGLVSSAGAVGPCQFLPKYQEDYFRYAGFSFDLTGWESIRGMAAVYVFYAELGAKRYGFTGDDRWRYALLCHRYGQGSVQAKELDTTTDRIRDVEAGMKRNGLWYDDIPTQPRPSAVADKVMESAQAAANASRPTKNPKAVARAAMEWAWDKIGCPYSQARRGQEGVFDCSSLVARAYSAQGVSWELVGSKIPTSNQEVYSDQFELLWPDAYDKIGKSMGSASVLRKATQAGDLQFLCTDSGTSRSNRITHVTMVVDGDTIVHARSTKYGVCENGLTLYAGKACALLRYNPDAPLRRGMKGLRVKELQERLNRRGAGLTVDGNYGPATEKAAKQYGEG